MVGVALVESIVYGVIQREGGFVNNPADRGGPTKYGITLKTLSRFKGDVATVDEVVNLTRDEAFEIYKWLYVYDPGYDQIRDPALLEAVVDAAVHSGTRTATKWLQKGLGITADGVIGPITRDNILHIRDARRVRMKVLAERLRHLGDLITEDPTQATFARGWMNRLARLIEV